VDIQTNIEFFFHTVCLPVRIDIDQSKGCGTFVPPVCAARLPNRSNPRKNERQTRPFLSPHRAHPFTPRPQP
jgi:hypothetical protein